MDMVILPGSKNTLGDLGWLRESGMAHAVLQARRQGVPVLGICGGYQMLGETIIDEVESGLGTQPGLGLLNTVTHFAQSKTTQVALVGFGINIFLLISCVGGGTVSVLTMIDAGCSIFFNSFLFTASRLSAICILAADKLSTEGSSLDGIIRMESFFSESCAVGSRCLLARAFGASRCMIVVSFCTGVTVDCAYTSIPATCRKQRSRAMTGN